jgi:hypothetical protein
MLSTADKAWAAGLVTFVGQYLSSRFGWTFITPELLALLAGVVTYWVPNLPGQPVPPSA